MSGRYVSAVFASDLPRESKFIASILASFADDTGHRIWPSVGQIAYQADLSVRAVQYHLADLRRRRILVLVRAATQWRSAEYWMDATQLPHRPPYVPPARQRQLIAQTRSDVSGVQPTAPLTTPDADLGVQPGAPGVQPVAPDPSDRSTKNEDRARARAPDRTDPLPGERWTAWRERILNDARAARGEPPQ